MIIEYHRPDTLDEALHLLSRSGVVTVPLAGGSALNQPSADPVAVVDLQALGLNTFERRGNVLRLGATLTLQALLEVPDLPPALHRAIRHEAAYNLRQVATVAGTLVAAGGRSPFTTALLALDAMLEWTDAATTTGSSVKEETISLGELLPLRAERLRGKLVTAVTIPANARLGYEYVARTPADRPLVCAAVGVWPSERTRLALGGFGKAPLLAMDGPESGGMETAARNAYSQAGDEWASAEYRQDVAAVLARRFAQELVGTGE
jgi:CO/xanthine dehydrogenase FAD-binding subunit